MTERRNRVSVFLGKEDYLLLTRLSELKGGVSKAVMLALREYAKQEAVKEEGKQ